MGHGRINDPLLFVEGLIESSWIRKSSDWLVSIIGLGLGLFAHVLASAGSLCQGCNSLSTYFQFNGTLVAFVLRNSVQCSAILFKHMPSAMVTVKKKPRYAWQICCTCPLSLRTPIVNIIASILHYTEHAAKIQSPPAANGLLSLNFLPKNHNRNGAGTPKPTAINPNRLLPHPYCRALYI